MWIISYVKWQNSEQVKLRKHFIKIIQWAKCNYVTCIIITLLYNNETFHFQELKTNVESHYKFNTYNDKHMKGEGERLAKGAHVGGFEFGSTVVLIFEAPNDFEFTVSPGDKLNYGQPLGNCS